MLHRQTAYGNVGYRRVTGGLRTSTVFLELHGDRVAYREAGDGPAVLLVHGMGGSSLTWHELMPASGLALSSDSA